MDATTFLRESYLKTAFQMFDKDGSGKIDSDELLQLLAGDEFKDVYTQEQLNQAISEVDENGDGEIDFEEFMLMMRNIAWGGEEREVTKTVTSKDGSQINS